MGCSPSLPESEQVPVLSPHTPSPLPYSRGLSLRSHVSPVQSPVQRSGAEPGRQLRGGSSGRSRGDSSGPRTGRASRNCLTQLGSADPEAAARLVPAPSPGPCPGPGLSGSPAALRTRRWGREGKTASLPRSSLAGAGQVCRRGPLSQPSQQTLPLHLSVPPPRSHFLLQRHAARAFPPSAPCPDPLPGLLSCPRPPSCPQARVSRVGRAPAVSAETPVPRGQGKGFLGGRQDAARAHLSVCLFIRAHFLLSVPCRAIGFTGFRPH